MSRMWGMSLMGIMMNRGIAALLLAVCVLSLSMPAQANPVTRSSSFAYDTTTGLLTQEVLEPNQTAYRLSSSSSNT